jgi:rhodanese-related sulfurtransferase
MKTIFKFLFCSLFFINCNGQNSKNINIIAPEAFSEKIKSITNAQLIDVRTPEEFASQKIENAKNINLNGSDFESKIALLDKKAPVFVYCKAGGRSSIAVKKMAELGFTEIYELEGGILNWNDKLLSKK